MKIILEAESKEEQEILEGKKRQEFTNVRRYFIFGLRLEKGLVPQDFQHWSATNGWLVGQTYVWLKNFEQQLAKANEKKGE